MTLHILALSGSLRAGSHNRQLAETAVQLAPDGVAVELYEGLAAIPFYNEDTDHPDTVPAAAAALRDAAARADAIMLFTPEHNGTMSAVLKNAIDWLSRPHGAGALAAKPVAVLSATFGQYGGVWAQAEARKALGVAGAVVIEDVDLAVRSSADRFAHAHPRDDAEVAAALREAVHRTARSAGPAVPAVPAAVPAVAA
ncbi:NAD(P)H-dependent oxidoreductase [Kitasatospora sp. NPDC059408]|uniref:NAD(P)H-dependent oxidoreductase n=1 Tax=Kitasatospora sp. NPDC059408 TaxID=3346823 RepID=UPI003677A255